MKYTICGGYRRGKATSGDVDVVLAPDPEKAPVGDLKSLKHQTRLLHQVLEALKKKGELLSCTGVW
jgi:DNA polymerase/3'-5' exonuclease PolX